MTVLNSDKVAFVNEFVEKNYAWLQQAFEDNKRQAFLVPEEQAREWMQDLHIVEFQGLWFAFGDDMTLRAFYNVATSICTY